MRQILSSPLSPAIINPLKMVFSPFTKYQSLKHVFMKYRIICFVVILILTSNQLFSQSVAINTDGSTANASALLDVKSNTKGILIPRMSRAERNAIATPAAGLLIFQSGPDSIGFYYYTGTAWSWILANDNADTTAWKPTGNMGTRPTHFIGTTDDMDLVFRRNGSLSGLLSGNNTSFGVDALNPLNTGTNNVAMGLQALLQNTTGNRNTAIGIRTLSNNTTGSLNTAVGVETLRHNTANNNVGVGHRALDTNTVGTNNVAIGTSAMISNVSGSSNSALGYRALFSNKTGYNNSALGQEALFKNTDGAFNTAFGVLALYNNTTSFYNTALGTQTLYNNTGTENTAVGWQASFLNTGGNSNVSAGVKALYTNTTGSNNVVVGKLAGFNTTGSGNVFLGFQAGSDETGSNKLYIANNSTNPPIIYGDFSNKTLGFGTITPNSTYGFAKVEIASEGVNAPTDLLIRNAATSSGYAPGLVFQHARGTLAAPVTVSNGDYLSALSSMNYDGSNYILSAGLDIYADGAIAAGIVPTRLMFNTMNTTGSYATRLTIKNDGNIGIGVTNPNTLLTNNTGNTTSSTGVGLNSPSFNWSMNTGGYVAGFYNSVSNGVVIKTSSAGSRILDLTVAATQSAVGTPVMNVNANSTVGIATASPNSTLHVDGTIAIGTTLNLAGGNSGSPVSLLNQKSYVGVLPVNATDNYYQLPDPASYPGRTYIIRNNSAVDQANITTAAGSLFPGNSNVGGSSYTLNPTSSPKTVMAISDGANWTIMVQN